MPKKIEFLKHDLIAALESEYVKKTKYLKNGKPKGWKSSKAEFSVSAEADKATYALIDDDPLLLAQLTQAGTEVYQKTLKSLGKIVEQIEKDLAKGKADDAEAKANVLEYELKSEMKSLEKDALKAINAALSKHLKSKKNAQAYKIKIAVKILVNVGGLTAGVAELAGSGFTGGFSGLVGLWTMWKELVKIIQLVREVRRDVEKQMNVVKDNIESVKKTISDKYESRKKEVGLAFAEFAAGPLLKDIVPSLKGLKDSLKTLISKRNQRNESLHKLARAITSAMKAEEKAKQDCKSARTNNKAAADGVAKALDDFDNNAKFHILLGMVQAGQKELDNTDKEIAELEKTVNAFKVQKEKSAFEKLMNPLQEALELSLVITGDAVDDERALEKAIKIFNTTVGKIDEELANKLK